MGKLFGTDGVRGLINQEPMTPLTITRLGLAIAAFLHSPHLHSRHIHAPQEMDKKEVLIGKDTRLSSDMVESALVSGLCAGGVDVVLGGILPTPAISYLTRQSSFAAGLVVSASHNPFADNGIKIFTSTGHKPSNEDEAAIEALALAEDLSQFLAPPDKVGMVRPSQAVTYPYIDFVVSTFSERKKVKGMRIVLDCSNGATSFVAPDIFASLGFDVVAIHNNPTGKNINDTCGSQHTASLAHTVLQKSAACGFAFDGDGDRVIAVDETGKTLTGDQILTICGVWLKHKSELKNNTIVRTVMSNQGMTNALKGMGIDFIVTDVGDRYVVAAMEKSGAVIGGEDSGHIIFGDLLPTGDGILTALRLLAAMLDEGRPLSRLATLMEVLPQVLLNVQTKTRSDFMDVPEVARAIEEAERELGETGRLLVRYSGTQNLCRVMVEAPLAEKARAICEGVAKIIREKLA